MTSRRPCSFSPDRISRSTGTGRSRPDGRYSAAFWKMRYEIGARISTDFVGLADRRCVCRAHRNLWRLIAAEFRRSALASGSTPSPARAADPLLARVLRKFLVFALFTVAGHVFRLRLSPVPAAKDN